MKKLTILLFIISLSIDNLHAQLKVFPGGDMAIGNVNSPPLYFDLHVHGNTLFSFTDSNTITSAAFIRGLNAVSGPTDPDYTWYKNDTTGIFHPRKDVIGFSTAGRERMSITEKGNLLVGSSYDAGWRVAITAGVDSAALITTTRHNFSYGYAHASYVYQGLTKNWVVVLNDTSEFFYVYGNGKVWSTSAFLISDSTLKENIHSLQNAKDKIMGLNGVTYTFKADAINNPFPPKVQIGLIAQQVEQVVTEA